MSEGRFISDTIEEVLVSIAESLREAQEALNAANPIDKFGRAVPNYQIPHLDFELGFKLSTNTKPGGGNRLIFRSIGASSASKEVTSRITGRFVAVPPGEGLPLPVLNANVAKTENDEILLTIIATNSAGEVLSGVPIELNYDKDTSHALSVAAGITAPKLNNAVKFETAVPVTNESGEVMSVLTVSNTLQLKAIVVVRAEIGHESVLVAFSKETV